MHFTYPANNKEVQKKPINSGEQTTYPGVQINKWYIHVATKQPTLEYKLTNGTYMLQQNNPPWSTN